jgi:hypothetical protein
MKKVNKVPKKKPASTQLPTPKKKPASTQLPTLARNKSSRSRKETKDILMHDTAETLFEYAEVCDFNRRRGGAVPAKQKFLAEGLTERGWVKKGAGWTLDKDKAKD